MIRLRYDYYDTSHKSGYHLCNRYAIMNLLAYIREENNMQILN